MKVTAMPFLGKNILKILCVLPLLALSLVGCATNDLPGVMTQPTDDTKRVEAARLHPGDTITIVFDGVPELPASGERTVNEDGTITLSDIGSIKVAGQTTGEIEKTIHDKFVPSHYNHLNVTVKAGDFKTHF